MKQKTMVIILLVSAAAMMLCGCKKPNLGIVSNGDNTMTLTAVKASKGLEGTRPIGKWSTTTGSYWHWVVEELQPGLVLVVR